MRSVNQDSLGEFHDAERGLHLLVVADGMGGHRGGEVASRIAIDCIGRAFRESGERSAPEILRAALEAANREIFAAANADAELAGMGTTGVALLFCSRSQAWVAHVGDSRAYRLRAGELTPLTADHSLVGELVRRGQLSREQARVHPQSNEILRAIGTQDRVEIELASVDVQAGDRYLLCSDGLSGMLPETELAALASSGDPHETVERLIECANAAGGLDNVTVQIADAPAKDSSNPAADR
jgi:protein phosphatase